MTPRFDQKSTDLFATILMLSNIDEAKRFFRDLLSEQEIAEFARRWQAAQMLDQKISYTTIQKETGLSSTTVARISKWLTNGMDGYRLMLDRINTSHHRKPAAARSLR